MKKITPVKDDDFLFEISYTPPLVLSAADVLILWGETGKDATMSERYSRLTVALSNKYGIEINDATAYLILEQAVEIVSTLKKTHLS